MRFERDVEDVRDRNTYSTFNSGGPFYNCACNTREETTNAIAVIIADRLGHSGVQKKELVSVLQSFFGAPEVDNVK